VVRAPTDAGQVSFSGVARVEDAPPPDVATLYVRKGSVARVAAFVRAIAQRTQTFVLPCDSTHHFALNCYIQQLCGGECALGFGTRLMRAGRAYYFEFNGVAVSATLKLTSAFESNPSAVYPGTRTAFPLVRDGVKRRSFRMPAAAGVPGCTTQRQRPRRQLHRQTISLTRESRASW
jgi:hypothetical protein